jgi:hypothetical protein
MPPVLGHHQIAAFGRLILSVEPAVLPLKDLLFRPRRAPGKNK